MSKDIHPREPIGPGEEFGDVMRVFPSNVKIPPYWRADVYRLDGHEDQYVWGIWYCPHMHREKHMAEKCLKKRLRQSNAKVKDDE